MRGVCVTPVFSAGKGRQSPAGNTCRAFYLYTYVYYSEHLTGIFSNSYKYNIFMLTF